MFDLDFALRMFKKYKIMKGQIKVYGMMGLYNEAVKEALANNNIETAEEYANKPESEENKKKLWLEIVKHLFQNNKKIKDIIELTNNNKVLKIQDILPHFNGNYNINDFKD